ncbi:MAG TPA: hypothetical protein PLM82_07980 [Candidatus Latescibacteria bacterium]|nr:hypothetical protein [Candidatus Latescibacterota bacterium]
MAPYASKGAAFQEHGRADARTVMDRKRLYVEDPTFDGSARDLRVTFVGMFGRVHGYRA